MTEYKNSFCRVAAYCRVSTDKEDQSNSLENQQQYFQHYIKSRNDWILTEIYVDEGITGTSTKKRKAFNRMITDAEAGKFDLIITKEISRFARNTLDSIFYTRKLKELGVGVLFLNDNIYTLDADAELRLTIMSSIAQEESRKTSERVKWGQRRQMEKGIVFGRDLLGYDVCNGRLIVNEAGAEIVRLIFHKYVVEGKGTHTIAKELQKAGIPAMNQGKNWSNTAILRILKNEKYCGDLIQKKTITLSYLTHEKKMNEGEEELVIIEDHHKPIIHKELFFQAQAELKRRSLGTEKVRYSRRYAFSGKVQCGLCGASFVSRSKNRKDGTVNRWWRCYEAVINGIPKEPGQEIGCNNISLNNKELERITAEAFSKISFDRQGVLKKLMKIVEEVFHNTKENQNSELLEKQLKKLEERKKRILDLYIDGEISKEDYERLKEENASKQEEIRKEIAEINSSDKDVGYSSENISTAEKYLKGILFDSEWNEVFYGKLLDKITVSQIEAQDSACIDVTFRNVIYTYRFTSL